MIERRRGHIVAISSLAGLCGVAEAIQYSMTKYGVRGFMEALVMQLEHDGQSNFIKTSTVFPYFVETQPYIKEIVEQGLVFKKLYSAQKCGQAIVNGVLREKEILVIPKVFYFFLYLT